MTYPNIPENETDRLSTLNSYEILDTLPEKEYDDITFLASMICGTPMSLVSLIDKDRQWFKSNLGLATNETPREFAFCAHAINQKDKTLIVNDARVDERFKDNPLVTSEPNLVFYAGVPLISPNGHPLGTLCVLDIKPKELTSEQEKSLQILSHQVTKLLELRKSTALLHRNNRILRNRNDVLDKFVSVAAHDIKSPINNILSLTGMLIDDYSSKINPEAAELIDYIQTSAQHSTQLIDGILNYSKDVNGIHEHKEFIDIKILLSDTKNLMAQADRIQMTIEMVDNINAYSNKTALSQIFSNLLSNSVKYNNHEIIKIDIKITESDKFIHVSFMDNGLGIKEEDKKRIFKLFMTTTNKDRDGFHGTGIGLATVKNLVQNLGGKISVTSREGGGSKFKFTILKVMDKAYA